jgi:serine/threonine-protein kinase HipA
MQTSCTIELYADGAWRDVATCGVHRDIGHGWKASTYTAYGAQWAVQHFGRRDAAALSCTYPVGLEALELPHWPVFIQDLLPQGFGRGELLRRLGLQETAEAEADWPLLLAGAGNPIGHLRIKEAARWLQTQRGDPHGFSDDEVAARSETFIEHLAMHGLFAAGSSGVQGEWPKLLLTRADDGLLHLDHSLPDERAREHYVVKFGRGTNEALAQVLRHEAVYMDLARRLGLRVHAPLTLKHRALFIPRFDRRVHDGRLERLAQESVASLTGTAGFGVVPAHEAVCQALLERATEPQGEILEYLRRDVANLALGNTDNHARNTAVQRDADGHVRLAPLFDFAPMYLHPDGIARRMRWKGEAYAEPDWAAIVATIAGMTPRRAARRPARGRQARPAPPTPSREALIDGLRALAAPLREIAAHGADLGLEPAVHARVAPRCLAQAERLAALA